MKIGQFRVAVDSLNWNRRDLAGATRPEFLAMDVCTRLQRHIDIVADLMPSVHARFTGDLAHARAAIEAARAPPSHGGRTAAPRRWRKSGPRPIEVPLSSGCCPEGAGHSPAAWALSGAKRSRRGVCGLFARRCALVAHAADPPSALALSPGNARRSAPG